MKIKSNNTNTRRLVHVASNSFSFAILTNLRVRLHVCINKLIE